MAIMQDIDRWLLRRPIGLDINTVDVGTECLPRKNDADKAKPRFGQG